MMSKERAFVVELWEKYCECYALDAGDVFDLCQKHGLLTDPVPYDPDIHPMSDLDPGDDIYFLKKEAA